MIDRITHLIVILALLTSYTILTIKGDDGNSLLYILVGYLGRGTADQAVKTATDIGVAKP